MIRKLNETDRERVLDYLQEEAAFNLFLIGDIEHYGFESEFQDVWVQFGTNASGTEEILAVLLRYEGNYLPYAKGDFDAVELAELIQRDKRFELLSAKQEVAERFQNLLMFHKTKRYRFMELNAPMQVSERSGSVTIRKAGIADIEVLLELRRAIPEFHTPASAGESMRRNLLSGAMRTYIITDGEKVVASASTTAENSRSAMVVAVCTYPVYRNKGYATACLTRLCAEVLAEGKSLCLFFDNPLAGAIYERIGFKPLGEWSACYVAQ